MSPAITNMSDAVPAKRTAGGDLRPGTSDWDAVSSVSVIGAGPCGCSLAADMASRGKEVLLYGHPDHRGALGMIEKCGGYLNASDNVQGRFKIRTSSDMNDVVRFSRFIVLTVPSFAHDTLLDELSQHDLRHHTLIAAPGNFFSIAARSRTNAANILETALAPYATRISGDTVMVKGVKDCLAIGAESTTHARHSPQSFRVLRQQAQSIFPRHLEWCKSLLQVGLANIGPVIHPATALMNAGWIEATQGDFHFYGQGMSPSVSRVIQRLDEERMAIARAYGFDVPSLLETLERDYKLGFTEFHQFARGSKIHNKTKGAPTNLQHRYVREDIAYVLVPWYELGLKCGLSSPTIKAIVDVASVINGCDFGQSGRNLQALGLGGASKEEILKTFGGSKNESSVSLTPLGESHSNVNLVSLP
ncbi:hypothetical protein HFD88_009231 [Aspergillus terreus]|nr:hypothetical protein HFD88_009231 [Aspergillus terreus]